MSIKSRSMMFRTHNSVFSLRRKLGALARIVTVSALIWWGWQTVVASQQTQNLNDVRLRIQGMREDILRSKDLKRDDAVAKDELTVGLEKTFNQSVATEARRAKTALVVALMALPLLLLFWHIAERDQARWE